MMSCSTASLHWTCPWSQRRPEGHEGHGLWNHRQRGQRIQDLFEQSEEIDILNAPAIAVAALQKAIEAKSVSSKDIILLNITGGGMARMKEDYSRHMLQPDVAVSSWEDAALFLEEGL